MLDPQPPFGDHVPGQSVFGLKPFRRPRMLSALANTSAVTTLSKSDLFTMNSSVDPSAWRSSISTTFVRRFRPVSSSAAASNNLPSLRTTTVITLSSARTSPLISEVRMDLYPTSTTCSHVHSNRLVRSLTAPDYEGSLFIVNRIIDCRSVFVIVEIHRIDILLVEDFEIDVCIRVGCDHIFCKFKPFRKRHLCLCFDGISTVGSRG